jgi:hypothetical protein
MFRGWEVPEICGQRFVVGQRFVAQEAEKESKIVGGNGYRAWFIGIAPERP